MPVYLPIVPEETICPQCKGKHWRYETDGEDLIPIPCICLKRKQLHAFLGPVISGVKHVRSPLYTEDRDATQENLFLRGTWEMVCRHLRWVLSVKWEYSKGFTFRTTDDQELVRVWLGDFAYTKRSKENRETIATYNNLNDLLLPPSLVIIRLGVLHRNRAAGDVLHETMAIRMGAGKPTWIAEDVEFFGPGHEAYTPGAWGYIQENYDIVDLGGGVEEARERVNRLRREVQEEVEDNDNAIGMGVDPPKSNLFDQSKSSQSTSRPSQSNSDDLLPPGSSGSKYHPKRKGPW